jgi:RNA polymerase sigma factor (sigma-70 family)
LVQARTVRDVSHHDDTFSEYARAVTPAVAGYIARRLWPATADIDDLVEETLLVAWRRGGDVPGGEGAVAWTLGVARNVLRNAQRARGRRNVMQEKVQARSSGVAPSAEDHVVARDDVRETLLQLSEEDREVLMLSAWDGLSNEEIGVVLGVSTGAGATRLSRARVHFTRYYEQRGNDDG